MVAPFFIFRTFVSIEFELSSLHLLLLHLLHAIHLLLEEVVLFLGIDQSLSELIDELSLHLEIVLLGLLFLVHANGTLSLG